MYHLVTLQASVKSKEELEKVKQAIKDIATAIKDGEEETKRLDQEIKEIERARDNELADTVKEKEDVLKEKEKEESKAVSALKTLKDNNKQEETNNPPIETPGKRRPLLGGRTAPAGVGGGDWKRFFRQKISAHPS